MRSLRSVLRELRIARTLICGLALSASVFTLRVNAADSAVTADTGNQIVVAAGATAQIRFQQTDFTIGLPALTAWIERSMQTLAVYYGRYPVARLRIHIAMSPGRGVRHGTAYGTQTPLIRLDIGRDVTEAELREDWILVHEMVHLALPDLDDTHAWLSEGLATYVEGIARVQAGRRAATDVWSEYVRTMPRGLPQEGDEGLDRTHTWGRTYWGGAIFCLQADVDIRRRTHNRLGLQDAMRAVAERSGGLANEWPIARVLSTADAATGTTVLADLYRKMKDAPMAPDLDALWKDLGLARNGRSVVLRDDAPLAPIRDAIMRAEG